MQTLKNEAKNGRPTNGGKLETTSNQRQENVGSQAGNHIVDEVLAKLARSPERRARDICAELGITRAEFLEVCETIRNCPASRQLLRERLNDNIVFKGGFQFYLNPKRRAWLQKLLNGEVVHPLMLEFHPGPACVHNCIFCYSKHAPGYHYRSYGRKLLEPSRAAELVADFAAAGATDVWVSGGLDPLKRPDVVKAILKEAVPRGLDTRLYTNGHGFDDELLELLTPATSVRFDIATLNNPELYQQIHRPTDPGRHNLEAAVRNAAALISRKQAQGGNTSVALCVMVLPDPANYRGLVATVERAHQIGFNAVHLRVDMGDVLPRCTATEAAEIMTQVEKLKDLVASGAFGGMEVDCGRLSKGGLQQGQVRPHMQRAAKCYARLAKMVINPYGVGFVCDYVEHPRHVKQIEPMRSAFEVGDFANESVDTIIARSNRMTHTVEKCRNCGVNCLINEEVANTVIDKFVDDQAFGIALDQQPFAVL